MSLPNNKITPPHIYFNLTDSPTHPLYKIILINEIQLFHLTNLQQWLPPSGESCSGQCLCWMGGITSWNPFFWLAVFPMDPPLRNNSSNPSTNIARISKYILITFGGFLQIRSFLCYVFFVGGSYHPIPIVFSKAKGACVWDPEGNKYLDFLSAYSAVNQVTTNQKINHLYSYYSIYPWFLFFFMLLIKISGWVMIFFFVWDGVGTLSSQSSQSFGGASGTPHA